MSTVARIPAYRSTSSSQAVQEKQPEAQQKVKDVYGQWFCDLVGLERLCNLPEVPASQLGLDDADEIRYPNCVLPSHLKDASAVRGIMGVKYPRPFVAVKTEILDPTTKEMVAVVVELIFKRYAITGDGAKGRTREDHYVTGLGATSSEGKRYTSNIHNTGLGNVHVTALKDLLEKKTIESPTEYQYSPKYFLRMA